MEVLKKIFDREEDIWNIEEISCSYFEEYVSRTYKELKDYGIKNLLPELSEDECTMTVTVRGETEDWDYTTTRELLKCRASFFDMDKALLFSSKTTVESEIQSDSLEEILETIEGMIEYSKEKTSKPN